jgi:ubiquinone/menaquinone biosynthesis C-methylase UbiE
MKLEMKSEAGPAEEKSQLPPMQLMQVLHTPWAFYAVRAAVELDLFSVIKQGKKTACEISSQANIDPRGAEVLLNSLVALGFLSKHEDKFENAEVAETYLIPNTPLFMGHYIKINAEMQKAWYQLADVIRSGKPVMEVNQQIVAEEFFPALASSIFPLNFFNANVVARELKIDELAKGSRVLDVASGSAVWSIPFAQANPEISIDALDFPQVLNVTKEYANKFGVDSRYKFIGGDWHECKLESNSYDVVILGHILHSEGRVRSEQLIAWCQEILKPGGQLVIAEFFLDKEKTGPVPPALFAINMFLATANGCVFSQEELESILKSKGFGKSRRLEMPGYGKESPILIASK